MTVVKKEEKKKCNPPPTKRLKGREKAFRTALVAKAKIWCAALVGCLKDNDSVEGGRWKQGRKNCSIHSECYYDVCDATKNK